MAKRKKSVMGKDTLTSALGLTLGAAVAGKVSNINLPVIPEKLRPAVPVLLGIFLMNRDGAFMKSLGAGMVAGGGVKVVSALAPGLNISGANETINDYQIEGATDYALAGTDDVMLNSNENITGYQPSYALSGVETMESDLVG